MRTKILLMVLLVAIMRSYDGFSQNKDKLQFNRNNEFKIVQFTDTHINQKKENINQVIQVIQHVVEAEQPDLVVFTGDIVTEDNPRNAYSKIEALMQNFNTKWVAVLGNHDDEHNTSRLKINHLLSQFANCLNPVQEHKNENTDFVLPVGEGSKGALLYFMDSNAYSTLKPKVEGYGWFKHSQVAWYKKTSTRFTKKNTNKPLPALAFFHIPLPEYNQVWDTDSLTKVGVKNEDVCSPAINTGMFAAMLEAGDVMGCFVGHDHVNDYIGVLYNTALAYGRCSGVGNAYGELPSGGRVIVLKKGKREFDTWIREANGTQVLKANFPTSFIPGN